MIFSTRILAGSVDLSPQAKEIMNLKPEFESKSQSMRTIRAPWVSSLIRA